MTVFPSQDTFVRGEVSPRLHARASLDLYRAGLSKCLNFVTLPHGGIRKRGGSSFSGEAKTSSKKTRVIPFIFSADQAYALELGDLYLRIFSYGAPVTQATQNITGITKANPGVVTYSGADTYANGDHVIISGVAGMTEVNGREFTVANVNTGANTFELSGVNTTTYTTYVSGGTVAEIIEVVTPWAEADIFRVQFYQSADQMWLSHPSYPTQLLTRSAHTTWTIAEYLLNDGPYLPINTTATSLTPAESGAVHPLMTSNTAPSGTASASVSNSDAWKIFNRDIKVGWASGGDDPPQSIAYDFPSTNTKVCDAYWMVSDDTNFVDTPVTWTFDGFDGSNWIVLDTRSSEKDWGRNERRFYEFSNKVAYQSYRISILSTKSGLAVGVGEMGWHESGDTMTAFNLTASSITGINGGVGFRTSDVGRTIRLLGSDLVWRWARIVSRTSTTVVTVRLYGHALPDLNPIINWRMSVFESTKYPAAPLIYEERLVLAQRFSVYASESLVFDDFTPGAADDNALAFTNAGGGQANDIVWLADLDGFLLSGTAGGIRALSGAGIDEALTPSSFKSRRNRAQGCAPIMPAEAGESFIYVARNRKALAELSPTNVGRFASEDIGQISEHIPKKGIVELAFQTYPDPLLWFPLDNGELGCHTHQPSQDVRGMHRHRLGGAFTGSSWAIVESACVTPGQDGIDDVWMVVKRTIGGVTKRYIEILEAPFEYGDIEDTFAVDSALVYSGAATTSVTGAFHLAGQTVDVLAGAKVYRGLVVSATGGVSLPGGSAAATPWVVGLPFSAEADTLELDVGGRDGSIMGRKKRVNKVILSLLETDTSGLEIASYIKGRWEPVKIPTIVVPNGLASLHTGNVDVPIDDSWEGQGRISIRHTNPTPCTIRAMTPAFDSEP